MEGIIIKALSGFYYVSDGDRTYECKARGNFRNSGVSPLVGDSVIFETVDETEGIINTVLPRKNGLFRPPVANIDRLYIVSALENPAPNEFLIDKTAAFAEYRGIEPVIVFNKCDMGDFSRFEEIYKNAGFEVYTVSALTGEGTEQLRLSLAGKVSAFCGNSGVGKSSILNLLFGEEKLETGEVSSKLGRGRHTTRHTELYALPSGGFVADTPGFSDLETYGGDYEFKENLIGCFRDLKKYAESCKFSDCTHICEKGCAVIDALNSGLLEPTRYESYAALFNELKDLKPWNGKKRK